jgi:hypothetical protein
MPELEEQVPAEEVQPEVQETVEEVETPEVAPEPEQEEQTAPSNEMEEKEHNKRNAQRRIDKRIERLERENEHLRQLEQQRQQPSQQQKKPQRLAIDDAEDADKWLDHNTNMIVEDKLDALLDRREKQRAHEKHVASVAKRERDYAKDNPDYWDDVKYAPQINDIIFDTITRSEQSAALYHKLCLDEELAGKLNSMHPIDAAVELKEMERAMSKKSTVSSAKDPIPAHRGNQKKTADAGKTNSYADYVRQRRQE